MRLIQVAQRAADLDRAADFYTVLLEAEPTARFPDAGRVFFDLDGVRLMLDRDVPSGLIYLEVENVHETLDRLAGIADVVTRPHAVFTHENDLLGPSGREEWHAFIRDTEGNRVGLVSFPRA